MAISSPNVQQQKVSDWEKGMQMGAQISQGFQQLAAYQQRQAQDSWGALMDVVKTAGEGVQGGPAALMEKMRPQLLKTFSQLSGQPPAAAEENFNNMLNYIKENPDYKYMNQQTATSYVWEGEGKGGQQQQSTNPAGPYPPPQKPTETNVTQTTTTETKPIPDTIPAYKDYNDNVVNAFTQHGVGNVVNKGRGMELTPGKEKAIRDTMKASYVPDKEIEFALNWYKQHGEIPHTQNLQNIPNPNARKESNSADLYGESEGQQTKVGTVKRSIDQNGKSSFVLTPSENLQYSAKKKGFKGVIEDLVKSSGAPTKGTSVVDLNRYFKMVAEENIPQMAQALSVDEKQLRQKYASRPNELVEDFNSLAPNMKNVSLPVTPGSPEYSHMFAVGVSQKKVGEIKTALDNLKQTLSDVDTGVVYGPEVPQKLVEAADQYTSSLQTYGTTGSPNKLERLGKKIATDPTYMRSVFNKMGGGDPNNPQDEYIYKGIRDSLDMVMDSGTRSTRISADTSLQMDARMKKELRDMGLDWAKFQLEMKKFDWQMNMDSAKFDQTMTLAKMDSIQKMIAKEKDQQTEVGRLVQELDKQLTDPKKFDQTWQKDDNVLRMMYDTQPEFKKLYIRRWGLLSTMTGEAIQFDESKDYKTGMLWWEKKNGKEGVSLPFVDTSKGIGKTPTEKKEAVKAKAAYEASPEGKLNNAFGKVLNDAGFGNTTQTKNQTTTSQTTQSANPNDAYFDQTYGYSPNGY